MGRVIKGASLPAGNDSPKSPFVDDDGTERAAAELIETWHQIRVLKTNAKAEVIDLALEIAKQIVGRAVELDRGVLDEIYGRALAVGKGLDRAEISVHPRDRERSDIDQLAGACGFAVCSDPEVDRAGCRIRADQVEIDATLAGACEALRRSLCEVVDE